jgi:hypothetical protein
MKAVVLLVTWFYYGQPPATSQTVFSSMDACLHARTLLLLDAERLKNDAQKDEKKNARMVRSLTRLSPRSLPYARHSDCPNWLARLAPSQRRPARRI